MPGGRATMGTAHCLAMHRHTAPHSEWETMKARYCKWARPAGFEGAPQSAASVVDTSTTAGIALVLLLLQYSSALAGMFAWAGRYRSIPSTLALLLLLALTHSQRPGMAKAKPATQNLILVVILGLWCASTLWSYGYGDNNALGWPTAALVASFSLVVLSAGLVRLRLAPPFVLLLCVLLFFTTASISLIAAQTFDSVFHEGRPLWNIRNAAHRLRQGEWIYAYGDGNTPAYPPLGIFVYVPAGVLDWDLRYVSVALVLAALLAMCWRRTLPGSCLLALSPAILYGAVTTQVPFYWLCLALFVVALQRGPASRQRIWLLAAIATRPLALPLLVGWVAHRLVQPGAAVSFRRIAAFRPHPAELALIGFTAVCFAVDPRSFLWNTLKLPQSDGLRAVATGVPQPCGQLALTPLLPFAIEPTAVMAFQLIALATALLVLIRRRWLHEYPVRSVISLYTVFLCFNFVMYNYYWLDVVIMSIASAGAPAACAPASREALGVHRS